MAQTAANETRDLQSGVESVGRVTRNRLVRLFGTPNATEGSVNEPRLRFAHGFEFNEKWTYDWPLGETSRPRARVIYWQRYDFLASVRIEQDGHVVRESEREILSREGG